MHSDQDQTCNCPVPGMMLPLNEPPRPELPTVFLLNRCLWTIYYLPIVTLSTLSTGDSGGSKMKGLPSGSLHAGGATFGKICENTSCGSKC